MASPIEDLHEFDLHIYVGTRSWPDDLEEYCKVTFPGVDEKHPITKDYMYITRNTSLSEAVSYATQDIAAYMKDPEAWTDEYYHTTESAEGRMRYQLQRAEREIAEIQCEIQYSQASIVGSQNVLRERERQARHFREQLEKLTE